MPWHPEHGDTTGLFEWCAVVLLWFVLVPQENVEEKSGQVTKAFLNQIIERREFAQIFKK
jgi:hypothetical protein